MTKSNICSSCVREGVWRCRDCLGLVSYCSECFRQRHRLLPFHRVEHWSGDHFEAAWLCQAGVVIQLGHSRECCPTQTFEWNSSEMDANREDLDEQDEVDAGDSDMDWEDEDESLPTVNEQCVLPTLKGQNVVHVIDVSGVHRIRILPCRCPNASTLEHQYLQMGLFPTSFLVIKTVVTFSTLEDQRLDNLECKTAVLKYWNKVRRKTAPIGWNTLPVRNLACRSPHLCSIRRMDQNRYREFMRVTRMWRNIQNLMQFGFGHDSRKVQPGELALFCATCPQPGINLPEDWADDPEE